MASTEQELDGLLAARGVGRRAGLLEDARGGKWAGWTSPRWLFLQAVAVLVVGAVSESRALLPATSTGILLAGLVVGHIMVLGSRVEALAALAEANDVRGSDEP